ncbi:TetR family transcriptional regulator [Patulibacter sp. SYSU D01012]|uniref:TetR family transcriptional regulator n=1 Tax=Patulibacter sp. SYSU D01012 TaxID=2817381 RepID=UPI001B300A01
MPYRRTPAVDERLSAARERLVDAATAVVADAGWAGASVTAVAAAAGMSVGSVYAHVASKADLAVEVFRRAADREVAVLRSVLAEAEGGPAERLAAGVRTFARRALTDRGLAYALLAAPSDPAVDAERLAYRRAYHDAFAALVRDGMAADEMPRQDADVTAAALTGAVGEVLVGPLASPVEGAAAELLVDEVVSMSLRCAGVAGLRPSPEETR